MPPVPTVSATVALPTRPPESLTEAMIRCVPGESVLVVKERPVPMTPSRLETHERLAEMSPASSIAVPVKVRLEPTGTCTPDAGAAMVTCGALLLFVEPGVMVTMTKAEPVRPLESATCAVITCVPRASVEVAMEPPVPIGPFRSETQLMRAVTFPSMPSMAVAWKVSGVPAGALVPSSGCVIVTRGGALPTPMVIVLVAVRPSLSVTDAVMTWRPAARRGAVTVAPVPSEPATLDDHLIAAERSPSLKSTAVPLRVTDPEVEKPSAGETTVRTGGAA